MTMLSESIGVAPDNHGPDEIGNFSPQMEGLASFGGPLQYKSNSVESDKAFEKFYEPEVEFD